jgi:hypothetical protein
MAQIQIPDALKADIPQTHWGKVLAATPVIMTVIATLLAGLASSEMTRAQYDRSLAAQQQNKATDEWGFFQAKRLRGAFQVNTLDLLQEITFVPPLDSQSLGTAAQNAGLAPEVRSALSDLLDSAAGREALSALQAGELPVPPPAVTLDAAIKAAIAAIEAGRPETEIAALAVQVKPDAIEAALAAAAEEGRKFDEAAKPVNALIDRLNDLIARAARLGPERQAFGAARLRFAAARYEAEARLNQTVGYLYELQVRQSNVSAEHHHARSQRFFYGMLGAQAAVIIATLAMASRQRNLLWSLAALAGLLAVALAIYVYFCF